MNEIICSGTGSVETESQYVERVVDAVRRGEQVPGVDWHTDDDGCIVIKFPDRRLRIVWEVS